MESDGFNFMNREWCPQTESDTTEPINLLHPIRNTSKKVSSSKQKAPTMQERIQNAKAKKCSDSSDAKVESETRRDSTEVLVALKELSAEEEKAVEIVVSTLQTKQEIAMKSTTSHTKLSSRYQSSSSLSLLKPTKSDHTMSAWAALMEDEAQKADRFASVLASTKSLAKEASRKKKQSRTPPSP